MDEGPFGIDAQSRAGHHRLILTGELDLAASRELDAALRAACEQGARQIDLDLRGVTFIDSVGLSSLLAAREVCEQSGTEMGAIPNPALERIFEVTGLLDVLPWRDPS
jgi:anti-anti-sigma factor